MILYANPEGKYGNRGKIGMQLKDKKYTFLHWNDHSTNTSKYKLLSFSERLEKQYSGIGPDALVRWDDE